MKFHKDTKFHGGGKNGPDLRIQESRRSHHKGKNKTNSIGVLWRDKDELRRRRMQVMATSHLGCEVGQ